MQHPNICLFGYIDYFELQAFEISRCRERLFLDFPYLSKGKSSKKNLIAINPLPRSFIKQGILTLITGEEVTSQHHDQTSYHKLSCLSSVLLRIAPSFLKIITLPQEAYILSPLSLLRWHVSLSLTHYRNNTFSPGYHSRINEVCHINKLVFLLLSQLL